MGFIRIQSTVNTSNYIFTTVDTLLLGVIFNNITYTWIVINYKSNTFCLCFFSMKTIQVLYAIKTLVEVNITFNDLMVVNVCVFFIKTTCQLITCKYCNFK